MEKRTGKMKMSRLALMMVICMTVSVSAVGTAQMPFAISGYVFYENGSACLNPEVTITNLNTGETFSTVTLPTSNYYRVKPMLSLDEVSEGDVLRFKVSAGTESVVIDHRITASDIERYGLHMNITFGKDEIVDIAIQTPTPPVPPLPFQASPSPSSPPTTAQTPTAAQTPAPTAEQTSPTPAFTQREEKRVIPGFGASSAIAGLLAISYLIVAKEKKEKREKRRK